MTLTCCLMNPIALKHQEQGGLVTIPDYQSLMRPVLETIQDGSVWSVRDLRSALASRYGLTPDELEERVVSGTRTWDGRVHWAVTYLNQARALSRVGRGQIAIAERGKQLLSRDTAAINVKVLAEFPEFQEFRHRTQEAPQEVGASEPAPMLASTIDPQEQIAQAVMSVEEGAAAEVLDRVKAQPPEFMEHLILDLMVAMGYGRAEHLGKTNDGGFDGVIHQDSLGLERIYLQAKRYDENGVGRPAIQAFAGALAGAKANRGVFITTSRFSTGAIDFADRLPSRVVLIDGPELGRLLVRHRVGVQVKETYAVVGIDEDYFEEA